MKNLDFSLVDSVYISGIELEETTGSEIVSFIYEHPELELYFSPGPRIKCIPADRFDRLLSRRDKKGSGPFMHLNETEALYFSDSGTVEEAAKNVALKTGNSVVITLGEKGCFCLEKNSKEGSFVPGFPAKVVDTVGAGDGHIGTIIACLKEGMNLKEACIRANFIGAAVVGIRGAVLDKLPKMEWL